MEMSARVMHRAFGTHLEVLDGYLSKQIDRIEERFPGIIEGDVVYRTLQDNAMKVKEMLKVCNYGAIFISCRRHLSRFIRYIRI